MRPFVGCRRVSERGVRLFRRQNMLNIAVQILRRALEAAKIPLHQRARIEVFILIIRINYFMLIRQHRLDFNRQLPLAPGGFTRPPLFLLPQAADSLAMVLLSHGGCQILHLHLR